MVDVDDPEDLVPVHVPRSRLAEVYRLLGSPSGAGAPSSGGDVAVDENESGSTDWEIEDLALISGDDRKSFRIVQDMLDVLATSPDTWVPMSAICTHTARTRNEIRGALSGFGRAQLAKDLGVPWWSSLEANGTGESVSEVRYWLSATAAERWGRLRS